MLTTALVFNDFIISSPFASARVFEPFPDPKGLAIIQEISIKMTEEGV
jgi:hypothetical protein